MSTVCLLYAVLRLLFPPAFDATFADADELNAYKGFASKAEHQQAGLLWKIAELAGVSNPLPFFPSLLFSSLFLAN